MSVWLSESEMIESFVNHRFPKHDQNELRTFASEDSRFQFNADDIWFIYFSEGNLVVGADRRAS